MESQLFCVSREMNKYVTYVKGCEQYSLNMVTIMSNTIFAWRNTIKFKSDFHVNIDSTTFYVIFLFSSQLYLGHVCGRALDKDVLCL